MANKSREQLIRTEHNSRTIADADGLVLGQVDEHRNITISRQTSEDDFIKIYYDTYLATMGRNASKYSPILVAIGKRMSYSTEGQEIVLIKHTKEDIAKELHLSVTRIEHMLKDLVEMKILYRKGRGVYQVSPFVMSKGEWSDVQELQFAYHHDTQQLDVSAQGRQQLVGGHTDDDPRG